MTVETDLTESLVRAFPELSVALDEHLEDQESELLPYLFMGEVARWLQAQSTSDPQRVEEMLVWLETAFLSGSFDERNLIDVGIVEMLPRSPEGDAVLGLLGPELRARAEISGLFSA